MKIVDLDIIKENLKRINRDIYAVVKNDCYGLGMKKICKLLIDLGVNKFCVNTLEEGIILRELNDKIYILLLSDFDIYRIKEYKKYNITVTLSFIEKKKYLNDLNYEIKLNMGLNRYGLNLKDYYIDNKIYYTHLPNKYDLNNLNNYKIDHFITTKRLDKKSNVVRVGMALYKDSLMIYERIRNIWFVKKGSSVGYNYESLEDSYYGVINIGYYMGLSALNIGRNVYIKNKYYKIVDISMNHSFIKIDKDIKINDKVELLGKNVTIEYISNYLKISDYEVFTMIKGDIIYKKSGKFIPPKISFY